jgi:hypothetical protein
MRPVQIGVEVIEVAKFGAYKLYHGDVRECQKCNKRVVMGLGNPYATHNEKGFSEALEKALDRYEHHGDGFLCTEV